MTGAKTARARPHGDRRSRAQRWTDAVAELVTLQSAYVAWLEALPESLQNGPTAEILETIADIDLTELRDITPPRGFGRD